MIVFISGNASNLSYQFPSLERDIEHWTNKKTIGCVHFPVVVLENFCPQAFVCMQSADFVRKDLTYCFPALFVIMYILILSNVVYSFKFVIGCEVNVGTSLQQLMFSLLRNKLLLGYNYGDFLTVIL